LAQTNPAFPSTGSGVFIFAGVMQNLFFRERGHGLFGERAKGEENKRN